MDGNINAYAQAIALLGAAIAMGIGTFGPAIGQGLVGSKACESIGKYPESYGKIRTMTILALGLIEIAALYVLLVAMLVIMRSKLL